MTSIAKLRKLVRDSKATICGDAKAQVRVKAVNTLLNGGYNLKLLTNSELKTLWDSLFFALYYAEMGRGCEEIIAAIERACYSNYRLTRIGFQTIAAKWYGLDQYRIDKVSHLSRHLLEVSIDFQISLWFKSCKKRKKFGTRDVYCKQLIRRVLNDVVKSYGLCYFLLEIMSEEISKSLNRFYSRVRITIGWFELKANLIVFLYKQVINFASHIDLDARLLRTFDQYVIKKLIQGVLPNESQLTQILISLRLYQDINKRFNKSKRKTVSTKCRSLFSRWSSLLQETHESCINGEYFPPSIVPIKDTINITPHL